jgi:sugar O-acyltransferase (sialic acid O-acetyltransferase NeuD family)
LSSKSQRLIFLGASAFPEISEIVRDINRIEQSYEILGILDDNVSLHGTTVEGCLVSGGLDQVAEYKDKDVSFVFCIGSYRTRLIRFEILRKLALPSERYATLIHPGAKVYSSAIVGAGCIIHSGAFIFNNTVIEDFVLVNPQTVIGTKNLVCEGALVTSLVSTTTGVIIGSYAHIGTASSVGEFVKIGPGAQVGMGSVVLKDVPPGVFCFGNPLRFLDKTRVPDELLERWDRLQNDERTEPLAHRSQMDDVQQSRKLADP